MKIPKQFTYILKHCSDEQKKALSAIRDVILNHGVKEFCETRHMRYGKIKSSPYAEIIFYEDRGWKNPQLLLRLPHIDPFSGKSEKTTKRYGMEIEPDGSLGDQVTVYQIKKLKRDRPKQLSLLISGLLEYPPSEPQEICEQLIDLALKDLNQ